MSEVERPPSEHSSRDPWPVDFDVPPVARKLRALAESYGWEVRLGYSRAYDKKGRGNVGGTGDARWVLHHFVGVWVDSQRGRGVVIYAREVSGSRWTVASAMAGHRVVGVTEFRKWLTTS